MVATFVRAAASHPTVLTVKYRDELLPVIKVLGTDPVVLVGGKEKRLRTEPTYLPQRAPGFSKLTAKFVTMTLGGTQIRTVYNEADAAETEARYGNHGGIAEFQATIKADQTIRGGFIAVVIYTPMVFFTDAPLGRSQIVVYALPDLPAGVEVPLSITSKMFTYLPGQYYFAQIFDGEGREVVTPASESGWIFYAEVERQQLQSAIKRYREKFAGANHAAAPVVMPRPLIRAGTTVPSETVMVLLDVSAEGLVTDVEMPRLADSTLQNDLNEALAGWLFFPKLRAGEPVPSRVQVPIKF